MIVKEKGGFCVKSESGKTLGGPYKTRAEAEERLRQIEFFKHKKSDSRLKQDVTPIASALEVIGSLNPVRYHWNYDPTGVFEFGWLAQEYFEVFPDYTLNTDNGTSPLGPAGPWQIDERPIVPYLVAAIKELTLRVEALENP